MKWLIPLFMAMIACKATSLMELQMTEWEEFKIKYGKMYATVEEDEFRMKIYLENKLRIEKHNLDYERGVRTYKLGMNKFGDLLPHEHHKMTKCLKDVNKGINKIGRASFVTPANTEVPKEVNWRTKGAVTFIKDQGSCGSCWAFSATGALEGQHFRKTGVLTSLSEQNLIDCSGEEGNNGCNGGLMDYAFDYVKDNGGIDTEQSYPYDAQNGKCRYNASSSGATDVGLVDIEKGNETKLMEAVATVGPISVGIYAMFLDFNFYSGGVYYDPDCSNEREYINHGVLVVGYGTDSYSGMDYWYIKNSWGIDWGDYGYMMLARNKNNSCGVATLASYPLV